MKNLKGTFTALVTPFIHGKVDFSSLEKLVRQQLAGGVDGFVINGTTAESPVLTFEEQVEVFNFVKNRSRQDTVLIMGTGSNNTQKTIEASRRAETLGADAVLVVVPYYNKPPQRGLYEHFKAIANAVKIPVILYNVPGRTITSLTTETIASLSKIPNIIGIKEASGKIDFASDIINACGKDFVMLSGDDGTYVEFLAAGGHGVISVATHVIPAQMVQWKKWVAEGEVEKARAEIKKFMPLIDSLFMEANPIPVKKALQVMGIVESGEMRLPLMELERENTEKLKHELKSAGVI